MKKLLKAAVASLLLLCGVQPLCARERIILLNEGMWQSDNGRMSYFEDGAIVSNKWFMDINGAKLGDTPNDIIRVNDRLIAIAVNWSNIVQFMTPQGKAVAATEYIPNCRKLATDGRYVYVSSYGHECGFNGDYLYFDKGYVAKIDINTFKVVAAVEVGYEPEGIAYYDGKLFVANTGGYAFQEGHDYETTVSVVDAETMEVIRDVDTGQINLYGKMSQSGKYLCSNSPGDYYETMAATIIFDCEKAIDGNPDEECFTKLDYAATYSCTNLDGQFYAVGSRYSYLTSQYEFNYIVIDPALVMESQGGEGIDEDGFPGTVLEDLKMISMPYGIYVNPYSGYIYATDAGSFASAGGLIQWSPEGEKLGEHKVYINPGHFLAVSDDMAAGVDDIVIDTRPSDDVIYNLQGIRVDNPRRGQLYITNGRKFIF